MHCPHLSSNDESHTKAIASDSAYRFIHYMIIPDHNSQRLAAFIWLIGTKLDQGRICLCWRCAAKPFPHSPPTKASHPSTCPFSPIQRTYPNNWILSRPAPCGSRPVACNCNPIVTMSALRR